jgi:hypothetical protein
MQEPANIPLEVMRHEVAMKHESTVFQFQSICRQYLLAMVVMSVSRKITGWTYGDLASTHHVSVVHGHRGSSSRHVHRHCGSF